MVLQGLINGRVAKRSASGETQPLIKVVDDRQRETEYSTKSSSPLFGIDTLKPGVVRRFFANRNAAAASLSSYFRVMSRVKTLVTTRAFWIRLSITCCSLLLSPYCFIRRSRTFWARPSRAAKFL